jgi:hypothetical protein
VSELEIVAVDVSLPPRSDDQTPDRTERHDGHRRVGPQLWLVVGVRPMLSWLLR